MHDNVFEEARRQAVICNACRYCEGYCSVFPALQRLRAFPDAELIQLANLCHNCRGCYYACQYTEPHEFAVNLPRAMAEVRHDSWKSLAWPEWFARCFERSGVAIGFGLVLGIAAILALAQAVQPASGTGFYAHMSHGLMVAIFAPAFALPLLTLVISLRRYWHTVGGGQWTPGDLWRALVAAGRMQNLAGGHGDGCNFEDEDRFSQTRRYFHQATLFGFLLCFAATTSGTVLHYGFGLEAPYGFLSLPKLLGVPGGILLCIGCGGLGALKLRADRTLGVARIWGGEMAFVLLLFFVSATGLLLYAATGSAAVVWLLPVHLGSVLAFFLLTPYSKMVHGFYRMAALTRDAATRRTAAGE